MIEDMSSTFESTLRAMKPIEAEGGTVAHTFAISTWGFPEFYTNVGNHEVHVLCTGEQMVDYTKRMYEIGSNYTRLLRQWLKEPREESWFDDLNWKRP